jgi:cysteinyl-tRNA synthetase
MADVLVRYLEVKGPGVRYTHIDDGALSEDQPQSKKAAWDFARTMRSLNVRPPDYLVRPAAHHFESNIDILVEGAASPSIADDDPEAATTSNQIPPARFRLQTAMVKRDQSNDLLSTDLIPVEEMLQRFSGDAIRIYLGQYHYRSPWTHDQIRLEKAAKHAEKLNAAMKAMSTGDRLLNITPLQKRFEAALDNDLDTVKAIATLLNLADEILFRAPNDYLVEEAQMALRQMATVFGLRLDRELPEGRVITGWREYRERIGPGPRVDHT